MAKRDFGRTKDAQYDAMDRRGVLSYTSGNPEFDEKILPELIKDRPKEIDFIGKHGPEKIAADMAKVERIQNSPEYQKSRRPISTAAEYAMVSAINRKKIFGPNAKARLASEADDLLAGVDAVVEESDEEGPLVYGIDVTISRNEQNLNEKLASEFIHLQDGEPTRLEYFPEIDEPINRYIIGIPESQVPALMAILTGKRSDSEKDDLALAVIELECNDEIIYQAFRQIDFILKTHHVGHQAGDEIEELLEYLQENAAEIKKRLSPELWKNVSTSHRLIQSKLKRREEIIAKKEGAQKVVAMSSRVEPVFRHLTTFDTVAVLSRAA